MSSLFPSPPPDLAALPPEMAAVMPQLRQLVDGGWCKDLLEAAKLFKVVQETQRLDLHNGEASQRLVDPDALLEEFQNQLTSLKHAIQRVTDSHGLQDELGPLFDDLIARAKEKRAAL